MSLPSSDPTYVRLILAQDTAAEIAENLRRLRAAYESGATSVSLVGMSGSIDGARLEQALANYLAAKESTDLTAGAVSREDLSDTPMSHTIDFSGRSIQW